ncbi:hypothetical protein F4212_06285 [Candidatus Poribacteria bacterium]|nr:hypothetical protein [Candidatus Poribacteria bacterium]
MIIRILYNPETPVIIAFMLIYIFFSAFTAMAQVQTEEKTTVNSGDIESQMRELESTLYCHCGCERMTYEICQCGTAQYEKIGFRDALMKGKTVEEIRTEYLEKYGARYSAIMPAEGINLLAYLMPAVILIVIGGVVYVVLQRFRRNESTLTQPSDQVSDELQQQIEAELEKYKEQN